MSAILSLIPLDWLIGLGAALIGALGLWFGGRKSAKQAAKIETLTQYQETRKAMDNAETDVSDLGALRERMRERGKSKRGL